MIRLQKLLASAGIASRRKAEELITAGRVAVNGTVVTELGTKVDPESDRVTVDGKKVEASEQMWIALHKPRRYMSTRNDPEGRPTIYDLLPASLHALFYVGRLDYDSEGLMLLTNAGDQAHRLQHPSFEIPRVYDAIVKGVVGRDAVQQLLRGVELEDGVARAEHIRMLPSNKADESKIRIALREGRNREVRRMMSAVGHEVRRLKRISYGPIKLADLAPGKFRRLTDAELELLR
jgi:23S rRNA pseudouridine2605 synthase